MQKDSFSIYIRAIRLGQTRDMHDSYLQNLPAVQHLARQEQLNFSSPVTFFTGENGTGKSTILEALAINCGFNPEGGTINFHFSTKETHSPLYNALTVVRSPIRPKDGFFLRAESFYNAATELDRLEEIGASLQYYGGKSLHNQSHGESFLSLILNRFGGQGLYILDEPEAALSPTRQMALLSAIHKLVQQRSQFIICTHSPVLMAYPNADIYVLSQNGIQKTPYQQTEHYQITRQFLNNPEQMLAYLLEEDL